MPLGVKVRVEVCWISGGGGGNTFMGGPQALVPGQGQNQTLVTGRDVGFVAPGLPHMVETAQSKPYLVFEAVPVAAGSEGSVTLANINTALTTAVADLAGATGTPQITPAELAIIQGWATGGP